MIHLFVCNAQKTEIGKDVARALRIELKKQGLKALFVGNEKHPTRVQTCSCLDQCRYCKKGAGAAVVVYPEGVWYGDVKPKDAADIVREHLGENRPVQRLLLKGK